MLVRPLFCPFHKVVHDGGPGGCDGVVRWVRGARTEGITLVVVVVKVAVKGADKVWELGRVSGVGGSERGPRTIFQVSLLTATSSRARMYSSHMSVWARVQPGWSVTMSSSSSCLSASLPTAKCKREVQYASAVSLAARGQGRARGEERGVPRLRWPSARAN